MKEMLRCPGLSGTAMHKNGCQHGCANAQVFEENTYRQPERKTHTSDPTKTLCRTLAPPAATRKGDSAQNAAEKMAPTPMSEDATSDGCSVETSHNFT